MKYISILRGINVSGQKKIKMADLKSLYESLEFEEVTTYIQSGNVIFSSKLKNKSDIAKSIELALEEKFGFQVPVQIRTVQEISKVISAIPFDDVNLADNDTKVLVTFLSSKPSKSDSDNIQKYVIEPERLIINNTHVYLFCPNGYGKTNLSNSFIEHKLNKSSTTRNWKTVCKLHELMGS